MKGFIGQISKQLSKQFSEWVNKIKESKKPHTSEWEANILFKRAKKKVRLTEENLMEPEDECVGKPRVISQPISQVIRPLDIPKAQSAPKPKITPHEPQIIMLHVTPIEVAPFRGSELVQAFEAAKLTYGEMKIFHYIDQSDQNDMKRLFSVASMVEPGTFDIGDMPAFSTPGISLFFVLEVPETGESVFDKMLKTAKLLAERLGGEVKNQHREALTDSIIQEIRVEILSRVTAGQSFTS